MIVLSGIIASLARRLGHDLAFSDIISVTKGNYVNSNDGLELPHIHQDGPKVGKVALENTGKNVVKRQFPGHRMADAVDDDEFDILLEPLLIQSQRLDKLVAAPL